MEESNWYLADQLYLIKQGIEDGKGIRVAINKVIKEFMIWVPGYGFKVIKFNPVVGHVTLEGAEEAFLASFTYSENMTLEEIKDLITNEYEETNRG